MTTARDPALHERARCGSRTRQTDDPCGLPAGWGTEHVGVGQCRKHGGNTTNARIHAQRILAEDAARRFGVEVETTADAALLRELAAVNGEVMFYRARVSELPREAMTFGVTRREYAHAGENPEAGDLNETEMHTRPNVWITLLHQTEKHLAELAATMIKLGIERRSVEVAESQGAALYKVVILVVGDLGVRPDDPRLAEILPRRFRELAA